MKIPVMLCVVVALWCAGWGVASPQDGLPSNSSGDAPLSALEVRSVVETRHETLTLYDLIDPSTPLPPRWVSTFQSISLGQSPPVGAEKTVRTDNLGPYLKNVLSSLGVNPETVFLSIPERIVLRRKAAVLSTESIEELYRTYIREHSPWDPAEMEIRDIVISGLAAVPEGDVTHEIEAPPDSSYLGVVPLNVHFYIDGRKVRTLRVAGKVIVRRTVVHASQNLRRDTILGAEHVEFRDILLNDASKAYITRMEDVLGKRVVRPVGAHQPLEMSLLDKPLCVTSGKPVTIIYQEGPLKLTAKGESKDNGAQGDWIRVVNMASQKTLKARVVDPDTVTLNP